MAQEICPDVDIWCTVWKSSTVSLEVYKKIGEQAGLSLRLLFVHAAMCQGVRMPLQDVHTVRQGGVQHARSRPAVPILPGSHHAPASYPSCGLVWREEFEFDIDDTQSLGSAVEKRVACTD